MEGNVDTRKRDCGEASLKLDVALGFLLVLGLLEASGDNVIQHFLHLLDTVCFRQLPKKVSVLITGHSTTAQYTLAISIFCTLR